MSVPAPCLSLQWRESLGWAGFASKLKDACLWSLWTTANSIQHSKIQPDSCHEQAKSCAAEHSLCAWCLQIPPTYRLTSRCGSRQGNSSCMISGLREGCIWTIILRCESILVSMLRDADAKLWRCISWTSEMPSFPFQLQLVLHVFNASES